MESPVYFKATWLFVWTPWAVGQGRGSGRGVSLTWESGLNSKHSLTSEATRFLVCLLYNLSHILCVFVRGLCQAQWLWKNNLTGFNLLPPLPPPSSSPCVYFFFLLFFCAPLRGREFILFGTSMPSPSSLWKLDRPGFMVALRSPVMSELSPENACHMWC